MTLRILIAVVAAATTACAGHRTVHKVTDESQPHVTWELRAGGGEGNDRLVCESSQPQPTCTLLAESGSANAPVLTNFHLHLHPAAQVATYQGAVFLTFLEGREKDTGRAISATVKPAGPPENISVSGLGNRNRGTYQLRLRLETTVAGKPGPQINRNIEIEVR